MAFYDLGPAILLNGKTMRPLSVRDWEELHEGVGYPHHEPCFKAGTRLAEIVRAAFAGLSTKRQRRPAIPTAGRS